MSADDIKAEQRAVRLYIRRIRSALQAAEPIARWGDGNAGYLISEFMAELRRAGYWKRPAPSSERTKEKISAALRTAVFERDAYRCVACSGLRDLTCDHIVPESKGGPTSLDNLQTMCRSCNCSKGAR